MKEKLTFLSGKLCPPVWHVLVILGVTLVIALLFAVQMGDEPAGSPVPKEPPDESNRVMHPAGFSIVIPQNWNTADLAIIESSPQVIAAWPNSMIPGTRARASIAVTMYGETRPHNLFTSASPTEFQGREAFEEPWSIIPAKTFDDLTESKYALLFQRDNQWFSIAYVIFAKRAEMPESVMPYLNSFRVESTTTPVGAD